VKKEIPESTASDIRGIISELPCNEKDRQKVERWLEWSIKRQGELETLIRKQELDFTTVLEMANSLNARSLDDKGLQSFLSFICSTTRGQFGVSNVFIVRQLEVAGQAVAFTGRRTDEKTALQFDSQGAFAKRIRQMKDPFLLNGLDAELEKFEEVARLKKRGVEVCVPLVRSDPTEGTDLKGLLCLGRKILGGTYHQSELKFIGLLGEMIAISLHNAQLHRKAIIDGLTQVYSRSHFDLHLESEISRAERYTSTEPPDAIRYVTLIMMDIDHFKNFNDTYGHQAGDAALVQVAKALRENLRKSDVIARYGGEEFAIIAPEVVKNEGAQLAERLRSRLEKCRFSWGEQTDLVLTASFGVATYPVDAKDIRGLVALADKALYVAKSQGRNRVSCT
jgi:diguanylate cyclase (GGDEF)-like protein